MSSSPLAIMNAAFGALHRGDVPSALALFTPDAHFSSGYPSSRLSFGGDAHGPEAICRLMLNMFSTVETVGTEVLKLIEHEDSVIYFGVEQLRVKATGKVFTNPFAFLATVRDGKLATLRAMTDSYAVVEHMGTPVPAPASKRKAPSAKKGAASRKAKTPAATARSVRGTRSRPSTRAATSVKAKRKQGSTPRAKKATRGSRSRK